MRFTWACAGVHHFPKEMGLGFPDLKEPKLKLLRMGGASGEILLLSQ